MQLNPNTIKSLRGQLDWTQQQLANACDVSLRTIQRVEKEGAASKETTMALCAVLEVRQGELIRLEESAASDSQAKGINKQHITAIIALSSIASFALGMVTVFLVMK